MYHGELHRTLRVWMLRKMHTYTGVWVTIEGAESRLGRSVGLAVNVNVATCGASLTHQYQRLGWRQQHGIEIHTVIQYLNLRAGF